MHLFKLVPQMAVMFRLAGRHMAATKLFQKAIEQGMREAKCHFNLASSLHEVRMLLRQSSALRIFPSHDCPLLSFCLGRKLGESREAALHYREAAELDPNMHEAKTNLAGLLILLGDPAAAAALCDQVLAS